MATRMRFTTVQNLALTMDKGGLRTFVLEQQDRRYGVLRLVGAYSEASLPTINLSSHVWRARRSLRLVSVSAFSSRSM